MSELHEPKELHDLIVRAREAFAAMTPEQREAQLRAQRESWVRAEMAFGSDKDEAAWRHGYEARSDDTAMCPYRPGTSEARNWWLGLLGEAMTAQKGSAPYGLGKFGWISAERAAVGRELARANRADRIKAIKAAYLAALSDPDYRNQTANAQYDALSRAIEFPFSLSTFSRIRASLRAQEVQG